MRAVGLRRGPRCSSLPGGPGWGRGPGEKQLQAEWAGAGGGPTGGNSAD